MCALCDDRRVSGLEFVIGTWVSDCGVLKISVGFGGPLGGRRLNSAECNCFRPPRISFSV